MLIHQPKVRIISRPVTFETGEAAFAYFALINVAGAVEIRFLGTKAVSETANAATAQEETVLSLPEAFRHAPILAAKAVFAAYKAPFVSTLAFLINQSPRAPSLN